MVKPDSTIAAFASSAFRPSESFKSKAGLIFFLKSLGFFQKDSWKM